MVSSSRLKISQMMMGDTASNLEGFGNLEGDCLAKHFRTRFPQGITFLEVLWT